MVETQAAVPPDTGRTLYRIIQEGLTNARKHAPGSTVEVTVDGTPDRGLSVTVTSWLPPGQPAPGHEASPESANGAGDGTSNGTGAGLIAFCIFCPTQYENLVWGFQLGFVIPATMATLAAFSLLLLQRDCYAADARRRWLLWVCVAAASAATWSLANGMLLWPLLLFAAWPSSALHPPSAGLLSIPAPRLSS